MTRVLFLTPYTPQAPSVGFRVLPFSQELTRLGLPCAIHSSGSPALDALRTQPGRYLRKALALASALARWAIRLSASYDVVVVHREAALVGPPLVERVLARRGKPLIFDFDDAIYLRMPSVTNGPLAQLLRPQAKTRQLIKLSQIVTPGNSHLAEYARCYNPKVHVLPTPVDTQLFQPPAAPPDNRLPVVGWVGSHSTGHYLRDIVPALERLARRRPFKLLVIGAGQPISLPGVECENRRWTRERMVQDFQELDVGLSPLTDDPWTRGKCGFKAIQYHAVGLPVVCSPVGVNAEVVVDGVTGYHASSHDEWAERLERLLDDAALRRHMGQAGRQHIVEHYDLRVQGQRLANLIQELGARS